MPDLAEVSGLVFDAACNALGCGGAAGLWLLGVLIVSIFIISIYRMNLGFDATLSIGGFLVLILAEAAYLPTGLVEVVYIVTALIWGAIIWRISRS